jgi:hypothetical protein
MTASMSTTLPERQHSKLPLRGIAIAVAAVAIAAGSLVVATAWPRPAAVAPMAPPGANPYGVLVPTTEGGTLGVQPDDLSTIGGAPAIKAPGAGAVSVPPYGTGLPQSEVRNDGVPRTTTELMGGAPAVHWSDGNVSGDPTR